MLDDTKVDSSLGEAHDAAQPHVEREPGTDRALHAGAAMDARRQRVRWVLFLCCRSRSSAAATGTLSAGG